MPTPQPPFSCFLFIIIFWLWFWVRRLDLDGVLNGLAGLLLAGNGLGTHDTSTPVALALLVLVGVTLLDGGDELGELGLVFGANLGQGEDSGSL
jgi:hypothetical protein